MKRVRLLSDCRIALCPHYIISSLPNCLIPLLPYVLISLLPYVLFPSCLFAQINTERFRQDADSTGFSGNADISATVMTGNTDFQLVTLSSRLNQNWDKSYTFLVMDGGMGWNKGERFFDQALAHARHVFTFSELLQHETFFQFDFNRKRKLEERELIGTGVRLRLFKTNIFKFRLGLAYMLEKERYSLARQTRHPHQILAHRLSSTCTVEIKVQKILKLITVSYYQPRFDDLADYKFLSENGLSVDLGKYLDMINSVNLRYDNMPPEGVKKLDMVSKFGVSLKF
jgi:hypothetical protein